MSAKTIFAGFRNHFGTSTPNWRFSSPDHVLTLSSADDETGRPISVQLSAHQAGRIRSLAGAMSMVTLNTVIQGEHIDLYLLGKKVRAGEWAGIGASLWDPESVATITMRAMAFSEGVISEANAILVVLDKAGTIHRFNRRAEEYTGFREEDVIGQNAQELFMSVASANESRSNISRFFELGHVQDVQRVINTVDGARPFLFRNRFVHPMQSDAPELIMCSGAELKEETGIGDGSASRSDERVAASEMYSRAVLARIVDWAALTNGAAALLASMEAGPIDPRIVMQAQRLTARAVQDAYDLHTAISADFSTDGRTDHRIA
ncbi:PAS domain S-box protein [Burkholderia sp. BCC0322]|uniref:PAS domain S-box protein n=1 Tax=unclassified Burkholderia TaxID=2613784 RepID=UPI0015895CB4|nr:PAS domain S-box protein [Burkholderia sp. BCC0322]